MSADPHSASRVDLERRRALSEKATPGPWVAARWEGRETVIKPDWVATTSNGQWRIADLDKKNNANDAAYIAACDPQTIIALLDRVAKGTPAMIEAIVDFFDRRGDLIDYEVAEQALNIALKRRL